MYINNLKIKSFKETMDNTYQDKLTEYLTSIHNLMYTFEITKCCGYSTFVTMYKDETLADLYKKVSYHFGGADIVELYFLFKNSNCDTQHVRLPLTNIPVFKFVRENIICTPQKLLPIYPVPNPVVYRLYLNDGYHCNHGGEDATGVGHCQNIGQNCHTR